MTKAQKTSNNHLPITALLGGIPWFEAMYYNQSEHNLVKAQRHTAGLRHGKNQCNSAIFWQDSVYNHLFKKNNKIKLLCACACEIVGQYLSLRWRKLLLSSSKLRFDQLPRLSSPTLSCWDTEASAASRLRKLWRWKEKNKSWSVKYSNYLIIQDPYKY